MLGIIIGNSEEDIIYFNEIKDFFKTSDCAQDLSPEALIWFQSLVEYLNEISGNVVT